jgi:hypothetical protein
MTAALPVYVQAAVFELTVGVAVVTVVLLVIEIVVAAVV